MELYSLVLFGVLGTNTPVYSPINLPNRLPEPVPVEKEYYPIWLIDDKRTKRELLSSLCLDEQIPTRNNPRHYGPSALKVTSAKRSSRSMPHGFRK